MLDSNSALVTEFMSRALHDKAMFFTGFMIFDEFCKLKPDLTIINE